MEPMVTIRNKRTGEMRQIAQSQLGGAPAAPQTQEKKGGSLLPLLGSILGGVVGAPLGPLGIIGGSAAGGGLGAAAGGDNVVKEATLGGLGGGLGLGIGRIAGPLLGKIGAKAGQAAKGAGESFIASQYNVPRAAATKIGFPKSIQTLADYGITDVSKVPQVAEQVTGASGIVSQITRGAVKGANRVELGATATGKSSVLDIASDLAADPSIPIGQDQKFIEFIKKGLQMSMGGRGGSIQPQADPSEVFGFIQKLEKQAASIGGGKLPTSITEPEKALKRAYSGMADELRDRLFKEAGGDLALVGAVSPQQLQTLAGISPQLARNVANAKTIGELRGVAAPFVKANQAAELTEAASRYGFAEGFGGSGKGLGKVLPSLTDPLAPVRAILSSAPVNARAGAALRGGLPLPKQLGPLATQTAGQTGARALSVPEAQAAEPALPTGQPSARPQQPNLTDILKMAALADLGKGGKNISEIIALSNFLNPPVGAATRTQLQQIEGAQTLVDQLEGVYTQASQAGELGPYGKGSLSTLTSRITGGGMAGKAGLYDNLRDGFTALIARSTGERGVLTDADAARAKKLIPTANTTPEFAAKQFAEIRKIFADAQARIGGSEQWNIPMPANLGL